MVTKIIEVVEDYAATNVIMIGREQGKVVTKFENFFFDQEHTLVRQ